MRITPRSGPGASAAAMTVMTAPLVLLVAVPPDVPPALAVASPPTGWTAVADLSDNGNDITLWPDESQTITVNRASADLQGATSVVSVSGRNMPKIDILAS
jgi:exo-1,4-beta-D-glucosaminidase